MNHDSTPSEPTASLESYRVAAYLSGAMSPGERADFETWIASDPGTARRVAEARTAWNAGARPKVPVDVSRAWSRVQLMIAQRGVTQSPNSSVGVAVGGWMRRAKTTLGVAGTAILVAGAVTLAIATRNVRTTPHERVYATGIGQIDTITLSDGTRVTLAPHTELHVDPSFGDGSRSVHIVGEARFEVANVATRPFIVRARDVTTRVLGTTFTVVAYSEDRDVRIAVQSGRVSTGRHTPVTLTANMLARVSDSTVLVTPDADLREYVEWTVGHLVFQRVPARDVLTALGRWYGLNFRFADSTLARQLVTGTFNRGDKQGMLKGLGLMLNVRMVFDNDVVLLVAKTAASKPSTKQGVQEGFTSMRPEVGR